MRALSLVVGIALVGLTAAGCSAPLAQTVISIANSECASCGGMTAEALGDMEDIEKAEFNVQKSEVTAFHKAGAVTGEELIKRLDWLNYDLRVGSGGGSYKPSHDFQEALDVQVIVTDGSEVDLQAHLIEGKVTMFDFFATWCGPCRTLDEWMEGIMRSNAKIGVRKINIVDWDSPVANQHLAGASNIPHVLVFSPSGTLVGRVDGFFKKDIEALLKQASETP